MSIGSQGGYFEAATVDFRELGSILNDLNKIARDFKGGSRKVRGILKTAAKPLREDMKSLAPVYKGKIKKGSKRTYYNVPYKAGTLKKSIASWHTKRGLFVAPRIGVLHPKVLGKPNLDGWYAHLALAPHKIRGGKKTSDHQSKHFIEKARLRKKDQVLRLIGSMARRLIEKNYRR
jgi:hypothetical protein